MPDRVVCVVQARQGSSRLPGKSLRPLSGRPLILHVLERARAIPGVDEVVLATSIFPRDDLLAQTARQHGTLVSRGSESDVLGRVLNAATLARADVVVRVTGDCPLLAPEVGGQVLDLWRASRTYAWNDTSQSGYPDGTDVEVVARALLETADRKTRHDHPTDREHVTPYIRRTCVVETLRYFAQDLSRLKLSVDDRDDLERVQRICAHLPAGDYSLAATVRAAEKAGEL